MDELRVGVLYKGMTFLRLLIFTLILSYTSMAVSEEAKLYPYSFQNEYQELLKKKYVLIPHKGTYLLPLSYNDNPNNEVYEQAFPQEIKSKHGKFNDYTEAEFQVSFLILTNKNIFNSKFNTFIGYTHTSWWQVYNSDWSRPFRENNYAPEVFFRRVLEDAPSFMSGNLLMYDFGFIHHSNGQIQELSRSWNRAFYRFGILFDKLLVKTTLWHRIPEKEVDDDNPRAYQYFGYGEIELRHKFEGHTFQLKIIPGTQKQGFEFSLSSPWKEGLHFYTKIGYGHGLSLLDYNHDNRKIGIGFILADPFTK